MLMPKRTKFKKQRKGRNTGKASRGQFVNFGEYAMQAVTRGMLDGRQIEAARRAIARYVKRVGNIYIRPFPDKPVTKKPLEVRQGKGKGPVDRWVAVVKPGHILFEIEGVTLELAKEAFRLAAAKLPMKVRFVKRDGMIHDENE